ncbi:circadian clock KaiB family protein [Pseudoduganella namucuonensis]|uniref:Circadian clock protein KaiB n=1 Tax=Pseudoduganella namucuonensis TaxID=1035707 RepID=A0A1I7LTT2_9BURK|nr:circadian clock KaiB family protein [Pseudoduganella namucuonensis]SFV13069.1 circadian clock protein KaiB [Pseudoduganella namucuonensis]
MGEHGKFKYRFLLYVTGRTPRSLRACANLRHICEQYLGGEGIAYELSLIDILEHPELAETAHILATPAMIRTAPPPVCRIIGDLSDAAKVLAALGILDSDLPSGPSHKENMP